MNKSTFSFGDYLQVMIYIRKEAELIGCQLYARAIFEIFNKIVNTWYDMGSTLAEKEESISCLQGGTVVGS